MNLQEKLFNLRKEIKPMVKDKQGFNYKYFDINQMIEQLQPLLEDSKLLLTQPLTSIDGKMAITTRIQDIDSDEFVESTVPLVEIPDAQKMGGCITYFRRYSLQSMLFLEAEDDDAVQTKSSAGTQPTKAKGYEKRPIVNKTIPDTEDGQPFSSDKKF